MNGRQHNDLSPSKDNCLLEKQLKIKRRSQYLSPYDINSHPAQTPSRSNVASVVRILTRMNFDLKQSQHLRTSQAYHTEKRNSSCCYMVLKLVAFVTRSNTQLTDEHSKHAMIQNSFSYVTFTHLLYISTEVFKNFSIQT